MDLLVQVNLFYRYLFLQSNWIQYNLYHIVRLEALHIDYIFEELMVYY